MSATGNGTAEQAPEPLVDLSKLAAGVRRRRRLWVATALVGLLAGLGFGLVTPLRSAADVQVFVVHVDENADSADSLMKTDLALLQTTAVAGEAARRLGLPDTPEKFRTTYSGTVAAAHILQITARAVDEPTALQHAQAVADAFITVHVGQAQDATAAEVKAYTDMRDAAQVKLDELQRPAPGQSTAEFQDQRANLSSRITSLDQSAQSAAIGTPAVKAGTKIISSAEPSGHSVLVTGLIYGGLGLLLGGGLGLALAAAGAVVRDRPVLRRDIAAHLGASVVAQLPRPARGPLRRLTGRRIDREWGRAAVVLAHLVEDDPTSSLSLLELGCPGAAATLATRVAGEVAAERPAVLVDDLAGRELTAAAGGLPDGVRLLTAEEWFSARGLPERVACLAVASVGPGTPWTDLRRLGSETLLVVRAGAAEVTWLHTVARQLADAGIAVAGIVLVDADPRDRTDGTLWDALHTAVRGRAARQPALVVPRPTRPKAAGIAEGPRPSAPVNLTGGTDLARGTDESTLAFAAVGQPARRPSPRPATRQRPTSSGTNGKPVPDRAESSE